MRRIIYVFLFSLFIPAFLQAQGGAEDDSELESALNRASGEVRECVRSEKKSYDDAVNWYPKVRDKGSFSKYSCQPMHSAQESPSKQCCDAYYAGRNKPGMWDEAWNVLQECGWRDEIAKRKKAYHDKARSCLKQYPAPKDEQRATGL